MKHDFLFAIGASLCCAALVFAGSLPAISHARIDVAASAASPQRVVGDGTPVSCTEVALFKAVDAGGDVTFNCGGPYTFELPVPLTATLNTRIDGGGQITLTTRGEHRLLAIASSAVVTVENIAFVGSRGGAIASEGDLRVRNAHFLNNFITAGGGIARLGGAIVARGRLVIEDSRFEFNSAAAGGAIATYDFDTPTHVRIARAVFVNNGGKFDTRSGGAIFAYGLADFDIRDSLFSSNRAGSDSGGAINQSGSRMSIVGTRFVGNQARSHGGAIYGNGPLTIERGEFLENAAVTPGTSVLPSAGGAIYAVSPLTLTTSIIDRNTAIHGGGIYAYSTYEILAARATGGTSLFGLALVISNTLITNNSATGFGGGVYVDGTEFPVEMTLTGSLLASNSAQAGGGLWIERGDVAVTASAIVSNSAEIAGGGVLVGWANTLARASITNTTIAGNVVAQPLNAGGVHNNGMTRLSNVTLINNRGGVFNNLGKLALHNTVLENSGSANCLGAVATLQNDGRNFSTDDSCGSALPKRGDSAGLGSLQREASGLYAAAPLPNSPLINAGAACPLVDQRGVARVQPCDIGAIEYIAAPPTVTPPPPTAEVPTATATVPALARKVVLPLITK